MIAKAGQLLRRLVAVSCRCPRLTVALSVLLGVLGIAQTLHTLTFETLTRALLPQSAGYVTRYAEYSQEFGELEDIVVVVEAGSFERARAYAGRLVHELKESPVEFRRVTFRVDPEAFKGRELLYLSTAELKEIRDKILDHPEFIESLASDPSLTQLLEGVNTQMARALAASMFDLGLQEEDRAADTRLLSEVLEQIASSLEHRRPDRSLWGALLSLGEQPAEAGYFLSGDKRLLFILVEPPEGKEGFVGDEETIKAIRDAVAELRPDFPDVMAGVTGEPALSNDESLTTLRDSKTATVLAFVLTLALMMAAFQRVGKPLLMLAVLAVSLAWSMGVVTLTVGHLTLFSVMFISIVVGIGIDYGIYFLFRYEEELSLERTLQHALAVTAARTGPGMLIGALTAGGTFFVLMLTPFRGVQEFGFIAGISILMAWLSMMTFFPATLLLVDGRDQRRPGGLKAGASARGPWHTPVVDQLTGHPKTILTIVAVTTTVSIASMPFVHFDYNLLDLQAKGTESVTWERRIFAGTGRSGTPGLARVSSLEELHRAQIAFERLPSVAKVDSVLDIIPDDQEKKIAIIKSFAPVVAPLRIGRSARVDLGRIERALAEIKRRLDMMVREAGAEAPAEVRRVRDRAEAVLRQLARTDRLSAEAVLRSLDTQLHRDFVDRFHRLQGNLEPRAISPADVPQELRQRFIGSEGHFLLQIQPRVDIWEHQGATQFVREVRSVDPDVTGSPIITYEATRLMERAYLEGTIYAVGLVALLTFAMIGRIRETLLAMLPLALALPWTIGLMRVFGIEFNLANIWGLPLIIGISAEFGLNVVLRYMEGCVHQGPLVARSTVMGVTLNGLTTIVGFGSLMVATHRGIFSLGLLLTIGTTCGLVASLVVLPLMLRLRPGRRAAFSDSRHSLRPSEQ